ncbi:hypothetical protein ACE6ZO_004158 [Salmonella enterica]|nr:hypothetical protein [Salmonella enterica]EHC5972889.1 hypothetical protein [Salmonella enterica]EIU9581678.1 hypothetical protein [Salmonella enterica]ELC1719905.1 hypothetical protein [Salmonella enterica]
MQHVQVAHLASRGGCLFQGAYYSLPLKRGALVRRQPLSELVFEINRSTKTCPVQKRSTCRKMGGRINLPFKHYFYRIVDITAGNISAPV